LMSVSYKLEKNGDYSKSGNGGVSSSIRYTCSYRLNFGTL
jgi:hypothetical protein